MVEPQVLSESFSELPPRRTELQRIMAIFFGRKIVVFGFAVILVMVFTAIFASWLAPYNPYQQNLDNALLQPSRQHLLGTDSLGRDTLSRIIYGTRTSLIIGFAAIGVGALIGMILGLVGGYFGGITQTIIMRLVDALMSFPMILLALVIAALLGGGLRNIVLAIGISLVSVYARLMWAQVLSVKQTDYILAERSMGASNLRIMLRHIFPNSFPPIIVMVTLMIGSAILAEAGLSFLGVGVKPPTAAWGGMVSEGYRYILSSPILSFAPGIAIMLVVFAFNMVGDGLRDALDPRLRGIL